MKKKSPFLSPYSWFLRNTVKPMRNPLTILIPQTWVLMANSPSDFKSLNFIYAKQLPRAREEIGIWH